MGLLEIHRVRDSGLINVFNRVEGNNNDHSLRGVLSSICSHGCCCCALLLGPRSDRYTFMPVKPPQIKSPSKGAERIGSLDAGAVVGDQTMDVKKKNNFHARIKWITYFALNYHTHNIRDTLNSAIASTSSSLETRYDLFLLSRRTFGGSGFSRFLCLSNPDFTLHEMLCQLE